MADALARLNDQVRRLSALHSSDAANQATERLEAELLRHVIDAQGDLAHDGNATALAEPVPNSIPMTGEEDPLVEVAEDREYAESVAQFMRSERASDAPTSDERTALARALLPFADAPYHSNALVAEIGNGLDGFIATLAPDGPVHPADRKLILALARITARRGAG